jgi:hypothetical protein
MNELQKSTEHNIIKEFSFLRFHGQVTILKVIRFIMLIFKTYMYSLLFKIQ